MAVTLQVTGTAPCAKAGSVIVFDSRVVHRGTPNTALSQGNPETPTLPPPSRLDGQRPLLYVCLLPAFLPLCASDGLWGTSCRWARCGGQHSIDALANRFVTCDLCNDHDFCTSRIADT